MIDRLFSRTVILVSAMALLCAGTVLPATAQATTRAVRPHLAAPTENLFVGDLGQGILTTFDVGAGGALTENYGWTDDYSNYDEVLSPDGQYLYSTNSYTSTVSTYFVGSDGSLTVVGSPVQTVPILSQGSTASPTGIAVSPDGRFLYITNTYAGSIAVMSIGADGTPTLISASDHAGDTCGLGYPLADAISPDGNELYVLNAGDSQYGENMVTSFSIDTYNGALGAQVGGLDGCPGGGFNTGYEGLVVSPDGADVYASDYAAGAIRWYTVGAAGELSVVDPLTPTPSGTGAGSEPDGFAISPNGNYLYVANSGQGTISEFEVGGGAPDLMGSVVSGTSASSAPTGVAVSPDGKYLFATNGSQSSVSSFSIDASGALTQVGTPTTTGTGTGNSAPMGIAVRYSCNQPNVADGEWEVSGCFTQPDSTDYDTTTDSTLDGLALVPSASTDQVDYHTGGAGGDEVTSTGRTTLALGLGPISDSKIGLVPITKSLPTVKLTGPPLSFALTKNFNLAGIPLTGKLKFTPEAGGTAVGTVEGTLPAIFGGGPASVTVTTSIAKQVTSIKVTAKTGTLADLFKLDEITLSYSGGTWTATATATSDGAPPAKVTGSLSYNASGLLTGGNLQVDNVVIAGLLDVSKFYLTVTKDTWGGGAVLSQATQTPGGSQQASVDFNFSSTGKLLSGSLSASGVELFKVFKLTTFKMSYAPPKPGKSPAWALELGIAGEAKGSASVSASLAVVDGEVTGAKLEFKNISLLGKVSLDLLTLNYSLKDGHALFQGAAAVQLPGTLVSKVEGAFTMTDGLFTFGSLKLSGNVPLYGGIFLTAIGAEVTLAPVEKIKGTVDLSAGPETKEGPVLGLKDGSISYEFQSPTHPLGVYSFGGYLYALKLELGSASMVADESGITLSMSLGHDGNGLHVGDLLSLSGTVTGHITAGHFSVRGTVKFEFVYKKIDFTVSGTGAVSDRGIVACANVPSLSKKGESGISYEWGAISPVLHIGDCAPGNF